MLRSFLLASCLLVCLACATPFPIEKLETGMTMETVREKFGAPVETCSLDAKSSWIYLHEELDPTPVSVGPMSLRVAASSLWGVPLFWSCPMHGVLTEVAGATWDCWYVGRNPVVISFEEKKIVHWETLPDLRVVGTPTSSRSTRWKKPRLRQAPCTS